MSAWNRTDVPDVDVDLNLEINPIAAIIVVGILCLAGILIFSPCAKAAEMELRFTVDRTDIIKLYPSHEYCLSIGGLFAAGIVSRNEGKDRVFKQVGEAEPANAIALVEFNSYTGKEEAFVAEHLFAGWDYADAEFEKGPKPIGVDVNDSNRYVADCLLIEQHRQYNKGER